EDAAALVRAEAELPDAPARLRRRRHPEAEAAAAAAAAAGEAEQRRRAPVTTTVEATGETVGEAKWKALRELERLAPSLDRAAVRFEVVEEGKRGLLGVGYAPARVVASVEADAPQPAERPDESERAARLRGLLDHLAVALG